MLDGSVLEGQVAHRAALAVGDEHAGPGLGGGQRQARGLGEAGLVRVGVVAVLLVAAAGETNAGALLGVAAKGESSVSKGS